MKTWTDRLGHSGLRSFTDADGHLWLEQNPAKASKWPKLARKGHDIAWEFDGRDHHPQCRYRASPVVADVPAWRIAAFGFLCCCSLDTLTTDVCTRSPCVRGDAA